MGLEAPLCSDFAGTSLFPSTTIETDTVELPYGIMTTQARISVNQTGNTTAGRDINTTIIQNHSGALRAEDRERKAIDWLFGIASVNHYVIQSESYDKVAPGTAEWILREPKFGAWLTANSGKFWGVGIPGAGKTILTSYVVNHLQKHSPADELVLFAYCRYNDSPTILNLLAALIEQLCKQAPPALALLLEKLYRPCAENEKRPPTENELTAFLQSALSGKSKKVRIIVDALDELRDNICERLVGILISLQVPIFTTSRVISISGLAVSDVDIHARADDLRTFIISEVDSLPKLSRLLKKRHDVLSELIQGITIKSKGMFLLASLQLTALEGTTTITNLRKAINTLPTKLNDMYNITLNRVLDQSKEESTLACRAILLVTHAYRSLSIPELLNALLVDPESTGSVLDKDALADKETLMSVCCGLLTVEGETEIVRLIHYTTHDFFSQWKDGLFKSPHSVLADTCALFLQLSGFYNHRLSKGQDLMELDSLCPFTQYACEHLGYHASGSTAEADGDLSPYALNLLAQNQQIPLIHLKHYQLKLKSYDTIHYGAMAHFAALHGILSILKLLDLLCFTSKLQDGYAIIHYACIGGHTDVVELLLNAERACSGINAQTDNYHTPLHLASRYGYGAVVKLLLGFSGIDVNARNNNDDTPLHLASENGHEAVVQLLLGFSGIDVNAQNNENCTPLHLASAFGHEAVVQLLLGFSEIDVNAQNDNNNTPLHLASGNGLEAVVQLLLGFSGIDVNAQNNENCTPLHLASDNGHEAVVQLLLDFSGVDVNAKNDKNSTPLHLTSINGCEAVVQLLLGFSGIDVNAQNDDNETPLHLASACGHEAVVQQLLKHPGINPNKVASPSWLQGGPFTALDHAICWDHWAVIKLLQEQGAKCAGDL